MGEIGDSLPPIDSRYQPDDRAGERRLAATRLSHHRDRFTGEFIQ